MIPESPIPFWQYFDLISLAPILTGVVWILIAHYRAEKSFLFTISRVIAKSPKAQLGFSILMTVFFPLYYAFLWFWVGPKVTAPMAFYIILLLSAIAEMIFIWLPSTGKGIKSKIHSITAGFVGMMVLLAPLMLLLGTTSHLEKIALISFYALSVMLAGVYFVRSVRKYTLLFEVLFCAGFLAAISTVAHT